MNKDKPLWLASQGFPATASMLPVMLSEGYHKRKLPLQRICQLLGSVPAKVFDLAPLKGTLDPGADADFTLVDLNKERVLHAADFASYADYNLHEGWNLKGWPVRTHLARRDGRWTTTSSSARADTASISGAASASRRSSASDEDFLQMKIVIPAKAGTPFAFRFFKRGPRH